MVVIPYYFLFELLEPVVSFFGYLVLILLVLFDAISKDAFIIFFTVVILYGVFMTIFSVLLGEYAFKRYEKIGDFFTLIACCIAENFGYRQINGFWRFIAMFKYRFKQNIWGTVGRKNMS